MPLLAVQVMLAFQVLAPTPASTHHAAHTSSSALPTSTNTAAEAKLTGERIKSFDATIRINKDATLDVTEKITIDFGKVRRHGIFRFIPIIYSRNGGTYTCDLRVHDVTDEEKANVPHSDSRQGRDINMRLGDAGRTVGGVKTYVIHYDVRRAINFFNKAPELYWNVTGDEWPYPMDNVRAIVFLPQGTDVSQVRTTCFAGPPGSKATRPIFERGADQLIFNCGSLKPAEEFTIVTGMPVGSVNQPSALQEFLWFARDWWPLFAMPTGALLSMLLLWYKSGRDEESARVAGVEWNPPKDLTPAEVGTLVDESCDMQDIISMVVDLAARGHLKIRQTKVSGLQAFFTSKDYEFIKTDPPQVEKLAPYENMFLNGIFRYNQTTGTIVTLSSLKEKFYKKLPSIRSLVYGALVGKGLFMSDPSEVRAHYWGLASGVAAVGALILFYFHFTRSVALGAGLLIAAAIVALFAPAMPARTAAGARKTRESLGFQRFVRMAEKERIRLLAKDDPTIFGRLLPYAMVLGAADQWALAFEDLLQKPPDWYEPYGYGRDDYSFSSHQFVRDLGYGVRDMERTFVSAPSSSSAGSGGSGFSGGGAGGGFGGGGGGSW